jgi:glycosyltransferase involved in cell wall biosynthesis
MLLGGRSFACPNALRIFWSEGHAQNVRHARGPIAVARRCVLRSFDAFAVPNSRSADHIRSQVGSARIIPLPNTVDEDFYSRRDPEERARARARLGIAPDRRVIVLVSSFIARKGVRELAQAYAALRSDERRGSLLAFVGAGPLAADLGAAAARLDGPGEIRIPGPQTPLGVRDWLMAADAFFLAAHLDANPLAPIEASFAGLPIFLSQLAGNAPEVVVEGVTGHALQEVSVGSLAGDLRRALTMSTAELAAMGVAARANADQKFRRAAAAENLVAALRAS